VFVTNDLAASQSKGDIFCNDGPHLIRRKLRCGQRKRRRVWHKCSSKSGKQSPEQSRVRPPCYHCSHVSPLLTSSQDPHPVPWSPLRNSIYRLVAADHNVPWYGSSHDNGKRVIHVLDPPPLAHVNGQIRAEFVPIYYGEEEFAIYMNSRDFWESCDGCVDSSSDCEYHANSDSFVQTCIRARLVGGVPAMKSLCFELNIPGRFGSYCFTFEILDDESCSKTTEGEIHAYTRVENPCLDWADVSAVHDAFSEMIEPWGIGSNWRQELDDCVRVLDTIYELGRNGGLANRSLRLGSLKETPVCSLMVSKIEHRFFLAVLG
jgi:hypothetical protein